VVASIGGERRCCRSLAETRQACPYRTSFRRFWGWVAPRSAASPSGINPAPAVAVGSADGSEADAGRAATAPSGAVAAEEGRPGSDEQTDLPTPLEIPRDEEPALLGAPGAGSRQAENESAPEPQLAQDGGQALPQQHAQHLLFLPSARGYLLLQRAGEAPAVGQELELPEMPGCRLLVSKRARSPLPLDSRVCAYLQPF